MSLTGIPLEIRSDDADEKYIFRNYLAMFAHDNSDGRLIVIKTQDKREFQLCISYVFTDMLTTQNNNIVKYWYGNSSRTIIFTNRKGKTGNKKKCLC